METHSLISKKNNDMKRNKKNAIKVANIGQVVRNKSIRRSTVFVFSPNMSGHYLYDNKAIPVNKFNELFPIQLKPIAFKGKNYDRTKNWIHGDKSY